ncbi:MAG: GGDEF domain-containing protein, partial [Chloroflexi bacterium]|nr:GGDEF domain-containing protein [Chloroflexota bacterium]
LVLFRQYLVLHDNRKLYRKMELQAVTDALTGVYNRHHFNEAIDREIKRAERYDSPLTLLLLDVDNFKNYNDTFGHLRGDILLKQIAQELTTFIRSTDLLARFGGDEFVIILAETDIVNAQKVADKITSEINARFSRERVGMSIGMAVFQPGMNAQSLLADADRSLYHSKPQR